MIASKLSIGKVLPPELRDGAGGEATASRRVKAIHEEPSVVEGAWPDSMAGEFESDWCVGGVLAAVGAPHNSIRQPPGKSELLGLAVGVHISGGKRPLSCGNLLAYNVAILAWTGWAVSPLTKADAVKRVA